MGLPDSVSLSHGLLLLLLLLSLGNAHIAQEVIHSNLWVDVGVLTTILLREFTLPVVLGIHGLLHVLVEPLFGVLVVILTVLLQFLVV